MLNEIGRAIQITPEITRVLAPNASPMTGPGTNSYLLGRRSLALIDPGPDLPAHRDALLAAIAGRPVSHILITHSHLDHSPLAPELSRLLEAPILAFGDSTAGRSTVMTRLSNAGLAGGGEGVDKMFQPHQTLTHLETVTGQDWSVTALHTPGHFGNHLCFETGDVIFSGDHIMGWSTTLISPPDGDLSDFMRACDMLLTRPATRYLPGHGGPIDNGPARTRWMLAHRRQREAEILGTLPRHSSLPTLTEAIYADLPPTLIPMAERNVFAHLVDLHQRGIITALPTLSADATFRRR